MSNRVQVGDICVVIEREVIAAEGLCKDCVAKGVGKRWAMVRRYCVPPGSDIEKLFGIGEGSIASKGKPDNLSTGAVDWLLTAKRKGVKVVEFTAVTQETVGGVVVTPDSPYSEYFMSCAGDIDGGDDRCWGLDPDWYDPTPPTPYRMVAWRMGAKGQG